MGIEYVIAYNLDGVGLLCSFGDWTAKVYSVDVSQWAKDWAEGWPMWESNGYQTITTGKV